MHFISIRQPSATSNWFFREDTYAEQTTRYADSHAATECMIKDCGFVISTKNRSLSQFGVE